MKEIYEVIEGPSQTGYREVQVKEIVFQKMQSVQSNSQEPSTNMNKDGTPIHVKDENMNNLRPVTLPMRANTTTIETKKSKTTRSNNASQLRERTASFRSHGR